MTSLINIRNILNIENIDKPLRDGKKKINKNRYYYYKDQYYIIELTKGQWMISEDSTKTRQLLRTYCWHVGNGYARTEGCTYWHQLVLNYDDDLMADHISGHKYDNRLNNLRIVTPQQNQRNKRLSISNTSGKQGLCKWINIKNGRRYWKVQIRNNECHCVAKYFSIDRHGDQAKEMAIDARRELEREYGYIGD